MVDQRDAAEEVGRHGSRWAATWRRWRRVQPQAQPVDRSRAARKISAVKAAGSWAGIAVRECRDKCTALRKIMAQDQNALVWLDMEMTGLDPDRDRIIEIAMVVTDSALNIMAEAPTWWWCISPTPCSTPWTTGTRTPTASPV
jgi:hypothetical protein